MTYGAQETVEKTRFWVKEKAEGLFGGGVRVVGIGGLETKVRK